jgi:hypothetical protein
MHSFLAQANADDGSGNSGKSLDRVIELSNKALSHLQFQDSLSARLNNIEHEMSDLAQRIDAILNGSYDESGDETEQAHEPASDTPAAGNIMLF